MRNTDSDALHGCKYLIVMNYSAHPWFYFVNDKNFYAEKCNDYESIKEQQELQFQNFKMIADILDLKLEEEIQNIFQWIMKDITK